MAGSNSYLKESFNPLPHAEGDRSVPYPYMAGSVSIHSLTQRETPLAVNPYRTQQFQSTPSRRGRQNPSFSIHLRKCFNPLPHAEGDRIAKLCGYYNGVSIHSLTQRETWVIVCKHNTFTFQSTPSRRGRLSASGRTADPDAGFQSTPSRRGRLFGRSGRRGWHNVSIHSLTQRETLQSRKQR